MKALFTASFIFALGFTGINAFAQASSQEIPNQLSTNPAPQIARFTVWIDSIEKVLFSAPAAQIPDLLVQKKTREQIFNIQALGRIYGDQHRFFEDMRVRFKDLEDGIGDYQKWVDYENEGKKKRVSDAVLARLKKNREDGRAHLERSLKNSGFLPSREGAVPYTKTLRKFLNSYAWKDRATDRNEVIQKLIDELETAKTAEYDFSHLEEGNGVHEFRRKMRWFSMDTRGLNGLITLKSESEPCPVDSWSYLINDSIAGTKYAVLPSSPSESDPVSLTPCLYLKIARMVEDVNQVKAKAEAEESLGEGNPNDLVAKSEQEKVQDLYNDIISNGLFDRLQDELKAGLIN